MLSHDDKSITKLRIKPYDERMNTNLHPSNSGFKKITFERYNSYTYEGRNTCLSHTTPCNHDMTTDSDKGTFVNDITNCSHHKMALTRRLNHTCEVWVNL